MRFFVADAAPCGQASHSERAGNAVPCGQASHSEARRSIRCRLKPAASPIRRFRHSLNTSLFSQLFVIPAQAGI
ncbi:hypothetical protein [Neisseria lactamica]|uniref:hypothetical protein n=1 Tax=Neisseria lactamica TaxID=486 RepID=UPI00128FE70A|nr:hypothetical protein [Neisseria lactamica]